MKCGNFSAVDSLAITGKVPGPAILALFGFSLAGIRAVRGKKITAYVSK